jgi:hypothetical protein
LALRGVLQFTDGALARAIVLMTGFVETGTSPAPRNISFIMKNVGKPQVALLSSEKAAGLTICESCS